MRQIEIIDLVDESPNIREPTKHNKRFRDQEVIDLVDKSTPSIKESTNLNKRFRGPDAVEKDDKSRYQKRKDNIEPKDQVATNAAKGNTSLLSKSTTKIRRCKSAVQYDIELQGDTQLVTPIRQIKTLPSSPHTMKLRRLIRKIDFDHVNTPEIFLDNNSCLRQCKKRSDPMKSSMESSQTQSLQENSNSNILGSKELMGATHCVKMQKLLSLLNAWGWCEKDIRYFMGSAYTPFYESGKDDDLSWTLQQDDRGGMRYDTFFDTYTSEINRGFHTTKDELTELWLSIVEFLEDSLPYGQCPSITIHHSIFLQGVRKNAIESVRLACFSYFERLILFLYPPHTPKAQEFYKSIFVRKPFASANELFNNIDIEMWQFLNELLEDLDVFCSKGSWKTDGSYLQLKLVLLILESDFASWIRCCSHNLELNESRPMLARMLWPDSVGYTNKRVSKVLKSYISTLFILSNASERKNCASKTSLLSSLYRRIIGMIAQFIDICDKKKVQNNLKQELIKSFMISLHQRESSTSNTLSDTVICSQLYCLKPDWLSAAIAGSIMNTIFKTTCRNTQSSPNDLYCYLYPLRTVVSQMEEAKKILTVKKSFNESLSGGKDTLSAQSKVLESCDNISSSKKGESFSSEKLEIQALIKQPNGVNNSKKTNANNRNQYGKRT